MRIINTPIGTFNYRKAKLWYKRVLLPLLALFLLVAIIYDIGRLSIGKEANEAVEAYQCPKAKIFCKPRQVLDYPKAIRITVPDFDAYCIEVKNLR